MLKPTVGTVINAKIDQVFSRLIEMRKKKKLRIITYSNYRGTCGSQGGLK